MKSERLLEEIKSKIDIVEFISDYVHLKKSGQNYKGLCPFHSEKTPSFMVSQTKQIFHCFGCGVGGDVVSFLMKHENLTFPEAIRYMAKKAGIKITEFRIDKEVSEKRERTLLINEETMKFFIKTLNNTHKAMAYLKGRGISQESIEKFCLGYASEERDSLFRYMKKAGHADSALKEAGLIVIDGNSYRDAFRRRIIFPIFNLKGDVIAFGGRVMDDSLPKYINSPETDVFKKGETLFAINAAKEEIRKKDYAIIVEGYLDAILCHQYGFRNTVAPLGTALTSRHLQKLKLLTKKVMLVFDSDQAGIAAAKRSLAIICENDFRAKVLLLPEGEDPDSFLRKNGSHSFKHLFSHAMSMTEFLMNTSKGDKTDIVRESLSNISLMKDMIIADELLVELADRSRIHESVLRSELDKIRDKSVLHSAGDLKTAKKISNAEEFLLLSVVIAFPEKAESVLSKLNPDDLNDKTVRSVFYKIKMLSDDLNIDSLLKMADEAERAIITEYSIKPGFDIEHIDRIIHDCLNTLQQRQFEERKKLAEESGDVTLLDSLLKEKRRLTRKVTT